MGRDTEPGLQAEPVAGQREGWPWPRNWHVPGVAETEGRGQGMRGGAGCRARVHGQEEKPAWVGGWVPGNTQKSS